MNKNKQLFVNMSAQVIAFIVNLAISFFLTPFIVENVGEEAYGFVGLANNFISYATIITTALNSMASRFITISIHKKNYDDASKYFSSVLISNIIMAVPLTVAFVFVLVFLDSLVTVPANILPDVTLLWGLLFANFILTLIGNVYGVAPFSQNRLELSSIRDIISNILRALILIVAFCFFKTHVWYLGLSTILCAVFVITTNIRYTKTLLPYINIDKKHFDYSKIKELLASGIWNSISRVSGMLSTGLDLLITNLYVGPAAMGLVSISKTLPTYILSVFGMMSSVFMPQLTISYAKDDMNDIKNQLISSVRLLGFVACIPMAFLYAYGKEFFELWMPGQDAQLLQILSILGSLAFPFVLCLEPLWNIFTVTNKVKQSSLFLLINSVLNIIIVFFLLRYTEDNVMKMYIVVGVSSLTGVIRALTFLPMYGAKCLNLKWYIFYPVIIKNLFIVAATTVMALLLKLLIDINGWFSLIFICIIMAVLACVINYYLLLKKEERKIIVDKLLRRKKE